MAGRQHFARLGSYLIAIAFVVIVGLLQTYITGTYADEWVDSLKPLEEKQLAAFLEMNRLLTTLGTTLLAAMGLLLMNDRKSGNDQKPTSEKKPIVRPEIWPAFASGVCVCTSIYFGYLVYVGILWMLNHHFFNLDNPHILWPRQIHFYAFLLGVVFFADFAFHYLRAEDQT